MQHLLADFSTEQGSTQHSKRRNKYPSNDEMADDEEPAIALVAMAYDEGQCGHRDEGKEARPRQMSSTYSQATPSPSRSSRRE